VAGPRLMNVDCWVTLTCSFQLSGAGLADKSRLLLVYGSTCGQAGATVVSLVGFTNPSEPATTSCGIGAGVEYELGLSLSSTPAGQSMVLCWSWDPGASASSPDSYPVVVDGSFAVGGPLSFGTTPVQCTVRTSCAVLLSGYGLTASNGLMIGALNGGCSFTPAAGTLSGLSTVQQPQASTGFANYSFGTPLSATGYGQKHPLRWGHAPTDLNLDTGYPLQVGYFIVVGPNPAAVRTCTLDNLCCLLLGWLGTSGFDGANGLLVRLPGQLCASGTPAALPSWSGLLNPQVPGTARNDIYVMGLPLSGSVAAKFALCWVPSGGASLGGSLYLTPAGTLTMTGPDVQATPYICYVGFACDLSLTGYGFAVGSKLTFVRGPDADCSTSPTAAISGLTNPRTVDTANPSLYKFGIPITGGGDVTENYTLCWGASSQTLVNVGSLTLIGPAPNASQVCTLGGSCAIWLSGFGLTSGEKSQLGAGASASSVMLVQGTNACGVPSAPAAAYTGFVNPADVVQVAGQSLYYALLGTPITGQAGAALSACWHYEASLLTWNYSAIIVGAFDLHGPTLNQPFSCVLGKPCTSSVFGAGLATGTMLMLVAPGAGSCGSATRPRPLLLRRRILPQPLAVAPATATA
jgi:hypothetical protein